ncbi:MAG: hypothetical protein HKN82_12775 [Akkermansiaceae bacterium]|nr:hypothetical protein [Akkermansiaceae bacterium]
MVSFGYIYKGLCGMARAPRAKNTMAGHLGAAVVAGYLYGEEAPGLDPKVYAAVERDLDRVMRGEEAFWYDQEKAGLAIPDLFKPLPKQPPAPGAGEVIAKALANNIGRTRQSGHNVIFSALAIRALHDHPEHATPEMVDGIRKLIAGFDKAHPGRGYFGRENGWKNGNEVTPPGDDDVPPYDSLQEMAEVIVAELTRSAGVRRQGFGGLFHLINHAAALIELANYGHGDLAQEGIPAHRHHLRLWKCLPDVGGELGALVKADKPPTDPAYWSRTKSVQWSGWLTHRIKTLYGFAIVRGMIKEPARRAKADAQFLYLMA